MKTYISSEWKQQIAARAHDLCEYCQSPAFYSIQPFVIEHIVPLSRNGETVLENLAYACGGCNGHKYNKTEGLDAVNTLMVPLFQPRKESWQHHFAWNENYTLIIGLGATGRATVEALQLNRVGLINMRLLLTAVGKHPPFVA